MDTRFRSSYIAPEEKQILFGREWLRNIQLDWAEIHSLHYSVDIPSYPEHNKLLKKYQGVFQGDLGPVKNLKAKLLVPEENTHILQGKKCTVCLRTESFCGTG